MLQTPDSVIASLVEIRAEASKGASALFDAEMKLAQAALDASTTEAKSFIAAEGNVAERTAQARLDSAEAKFAEEVARAEYNRVRTKIKILEQAQMSIQTQARMVELMYKSAGQGER